VVCVNDIKAPRCPSRLPKVLAGSAIWVWYVR
jgi:hypothetical protein